MLTPMTVKHIKISGEEHIYPTYSVTFTPKSVEASRVQGAVSAPACDSVWIDNPDGGRQQLFGGTVFVMNEQGKTVSRYDLGASNVPPGENPHTTARNCVPVGIAGGLEIAAAARAAGPTGY